MSQGQSETNAFFFTIRYAVYPKTAFFLLTLYICFRYGVDRAQPVLRPHRQPHPDLRRGPGM